MSDPDFFDVVMAQRACRWFGPDPVPDRDLERMLSAAVRAPSAENSQPWVFVVVRDEGRRAAIDDTARRLWAGGAREHAAAHMPAAAVDDITKSIEAGFGGAPVLVVVGADTSRVERRAMASSLFPCVQNLLLAAGALGYGAALTTLATVAADDLRAAVGLPDSVVPVAVVPVGRPARPMGRSRREPVTAKASLDAYGTPFPTVTAASA